ncbi:AAA family ATPase [Saccharospirillum alexandrii]|uniref:AAA family ATPase n=1 Tax=Saccharospirillum alexandrii TaxID=2448477 RepID=UPI001FE2C961|nr:AAA family ATPase [Saccharospirillum alexandrii]
MNETGSPMATQHPLLELKDALQHRILGQPELVESLLLALLADGHLLVEGAPGLAKTTAIKALAEGVHGAFSRVQFTPDLMPSDITGAEIYRADEHRFEFQPGPVFANLVLADEINRAPAKVQSALLEAMSERQVSVAGTTYPLASPFLVMATQNPVEHEGTYPLPEAQLDRFLLKVSLDYPDVGIEHAILKLAREEEALQTRALPQVSPDDVLAARRALNDVYMADAVTDYLVHLVDATRSPERYSAELAGVIEFGASPRGTIALDRCARALAWLEGQDFVTPEHVQQVAVRVLAHRLVLSLSGQAQGWSGVSVVNHLLERVAVG